MSTADVLIELCEAIVGEINTLLKLGAVRRYLTTATREEMQDRSVVVFPNAAPEEGLTRQGKTTRFEVNILVFRAVSRGGTGPASQPLDTPQQTANIDEELKRVFEIRDLWNLQPDGTEGPLFKKTLADCQPENLETEPLWNAEALLNNGEFRSVTTVTYVHEPQA